MKKLAYTLIFAAMAVTASAADNNPVAPVDTVVNLSHTDIVVSQNEDGLLFDFRTQDGQDLSYEYPYVEGQTYKVDRTYTNPATIFHRNNFSIGFSGFSVGFVKALDAPEGLNQEMGRSLEFSLDQIVSFQWQLPSRRDMLAIGIGVDWRNYRTTGANRFFRTGNQVQTGPWEEGRTPVDSRLKTFGLQFPISYVHTFNSYMKAGVAVILNANTYGSLKSHYLDADGVKYETFQKCTGEISKFAVDFKATFQFCPFVAVYCKYSPMKVFRKDRGPEFTPLTAGFTFFY